tara:strand:+ start:361 stop:558 length:198 start_codon:yes stop_codon:yes gene_type:complete
VSNSSETQVSTELLSEWRNTGVIGTEEVAFKVGDLFVAENVVTRKRRVIDPQVRESVTNKRILKG